jgi:hypothetical protein
MVMASLYLITIPLSFAFLWFCLKITGHPINQALKPTVIMCFTGLLLDGIAISQFSALYGTTSERVMLGAAWLLFGVGTILMAGYILQSNDSPPISVTAPS